MNPDDFRGPGFKSGYDPVWMDLLSKHAKQPFHALVGGGDQLYCDMYALSSSHCISNELTFSSVSCANPKCKNGFPYPKLKTRNPICYHPRRSSASINSFLTTIVRHLGEEHLQGLIVPCE